MAAVRRVPGADAEDDVSQRRGPTRSRVEDPRVRHDSQPRERRLVDGAALASEVGLHTACAFSARHQSTCLVCRRAPESRMARARCRASRRSARDGHALRIGPNLLRCAWERASSASPQSNVDDARAVANERCGRSFHARASAHGESTAPVDRPSSWRVRPRLSGVERPIFADRSRPLDQALFLLDA